VVINKAIIVNNNNLDKLSTFVNMGGDYPGSKPRRRNHVGKIRQFIFLRRP